MSGYCTSHARAVTAVHGQSTFAFKMREKWAQPALAKNATVPCRECPTLQSFLLYIIPTS
eukprot:6193637-Pleurochrysis_carterae.AAC.3